MVIPAVSKIRALSIGAILLVCTHVFGEDAGEQLKVISVTPSGDEVPVSRGEIIIEFNKNMVAFGQTDIDLSNVPVEIKPELKCTWRWTSLSQLTCTHSDFLKYTTSYVISIGKSVKALDGSNLTSDRKFSFRTASLGVRGSASYWRSATRPIFDVNFTQPMPLSMILEKVHIRNLKTSELHEIEAVDLASLTSFVRNGSDFFILDESGEWTRAGESEKEALLKAMKWGIDREKFVNEKLEFATRSWYLESKSPLDPDSTYDLEIDSNVKSILATEPTTRSMHITRFEVYPKFELLGLECIDNKGSFRQQLFSEAAGNEETLTGCNPDEGITLLLTAPTEASYKVYESLLHPGPEYERFSTRSRFYTFDRGAVHRISNWGSSRNEEHFATEDDLNKVKLGYELRGNTTYELKFGNAFIHDVFGRRLRNAPDIKFHTGHLKPRLNTRSSRIVLSPESNFEVPVHAANLNDLRVKIASKTDSSLKWSVRNKRQTLNLTADRIVSTNLDFKDWLSEDSHRFVAAIAPVANPSYGDDPETECIFGQVTPYNVHALIGLTSSIAWLTDIETGQLVSDASVSLMEMGASNDKVLATAATDKQGIAHLPGRRSFSPGMKENRTEESFDVFKGIDCTNSFPARHALQIDGPKGQAFLPLARRLIKSGSDSLRSSNLSVWGHTAQGMYRPGEVLQYKIFVRNQTDKGLRTDETQRFRLVVTQGYGELVLHENDIELSKFGSFNGELKIPETTRSDRSLRFLVMVDEGESFSSIWNEERDSMKYGEVEYWTAFEVPVLDFDPATILIDSSLSKVEYEIGDELVVTGRSDLISGGSFSHAPIAVEAILKPKAFESKHPETKDYSFVSAEGKEHYWKQDDFQTVTPTTNAQGDLSASLKLNAADVHFGSLTISLGVQEDDGNIIWEDHRAKYRGTDRFVGVRQIGERARVGETVRVDAVVVDPQGEPRNDRPVTLKYFRVRYLDRTESTADVLVHSCEIATHHKPKLCATVPKMAGHYRAVASIKTDDGRIQKATKSIYVQGRIKDVVSEREDHVSLVNARELRDRLFRVGDFASLVVQHSVPGAMALVTVERLGILDQWVTELEGSHDVIDIPIRQDYAPVVRATVTVTTANSNIKPSSYFGSVGKQGYPASWRQSVQLRIKDATRRLDVQVSTDKEIYEPGDRVKVSIAVNDESPQGNPPKVELAVAVVDQGVLEVSRTGIAHFDPVRGLLRNMDVAVDSYWLLWEGVRYAYRTAFDTAIGRGPRSNNDLTSLWLPNLETNDDGIATLDFEIGDRLTEWKIIVVAATPTDQFGLGQMSVKTNLGVEIRPVLPNQVTNGDVFDASFSVLNRSDSVREVTVKIEAEGDAEESSFTESISLNPFERKLVSTKTKARLKSGQDQTRGSIRIFASALSKEDSDALVQDVPVHPSKRFFVSSIYGTSTDATVSEPIAIPRDITNGSGRLKVHLTPSLLNTVEDHVTQVRDYPYQCWEQRLSSAVVAAQFSRLKERLNVDWKNATQYIDDVLKAAEKFQSERSGGFGYWSGESSHADLYLSAYTALAFRWLADAGYKVPEEVLEKLLEFLEDQTVYRLPDYLSLNRSVVPSLRLMIANALVQHGKGDLDLLTTLFEESEKPNLFSIAQSLKAAMSLAAADEIVEPLVTRLTNSVGVVGDRALIHHVSNGRRNFMLSSQLKTTCSAISAFVEASNRGSELISQEKLAELVRGVLFVWNRQKFGTNPHQASFCLSAIAEYAESVETVDEDFIADVDLVMDGQLSPPKFEVATKKNLIDGSFVYSTPLKPELNGIPADLQMKQSGDSRFYYKATLQYEPTEVQTDRENFGIDVRKTYWVKSGDHWKVLDDSHELQRGDVVHVGLYLDIRDQRDFVIVDDPVPGFLQPINVRLAKTNIRETQPAIDDYRNIFPDHIEGKWHRLGSSRWGFYNRQIRNESVRFASDFLPSGRYRLYWAGRVISTGEFLARPAHAEAMYSPEVYGNSRPQRIAVILE